MVSRAISRKACAYPSDTARIDRRSPFHEYCSSVSTEKPAETRMGSGKGSPEYWAAVVKPGRVMFEMAGVSEEVAREALRLASHKLPVRCKICKRGELVSADKEEKA